MSYDVLAAAYSQQESTDDMARKCAFPPMESSPLERERKRKR